MRILIATSHRELVGGAETYLQAIIPLLVNEGHSIGIAYEWLDGETRPRIDSGASGLATWCLERLSLREVLEGIRKWQPDVVYAQGLQNGDFEDALLESYTTVLFAHGYYGTCATGTKCHAFPHIRPCSRSFGPMCLALHYPRRCGGLNPLRAWQTFRHTAQRNARLSRYQAVLVASHHMKRELGRHGVSSDKLHLVSLPVAESFEIAEPLTDKLCKSRILFIGRLVAVKGARELIQAIPEATRQLGRPLALRIVGDGPQRPRLQSLAQSLRVHVEFTGWLNVARRLDCLREADLLAAPSLWPEPFGLVGIEAAQLNVPAVAYDVGGIPDWLIPGQSGELAPGDPPTTHGLAAAIIRALADPLHYLKLCQGAKERARGYNRKAHIVQLTAIFDTVTHE